MDFTNRGTVRAHNAHASASGRSAAAHHTAAHAANPSSPAPAAPSLPKEPEQRREHGGPGWMRILSVVLLFSLTILTLAIALSLHFNRPPQPALTMSEAQYVDSHSYQAVILSSGQVYYGKVKAVSPDYLILQNIYYLTPSDSKTPPSNANPSLVKLGCELHGPTDQMVINRSRLDFWENLSSDGQVSKAIAKWQQDNPDGLKCGTAGAANNTKQP